jgi:hypothetical protein
VTSRWPEKSSSPGATATKNANAYTITGDATVLDSSTYPTTKANGKVAALVTAVESGVAVEDLTAALRRRTAERDELKPALSEPKDRAPCLPHRSASRSRSGAGCQRCLVRQPGRNALRCTRAWVCVLITIPISDESRRRPT